MSTTATSPSATETAYPSVQLFIAGQWRDGGERKTLAVHNPATGKPIGSVAVATRADLDAACAAAQQGFEAWRKVPAFERAKTMREAARLLRERADGIARCMTQEQGKPLAEAKGEIIMAAADIIEWFADEGRRVLGPHRPAPRQAGVLQRCSRSRSARWRRSRHGTSRSTRWCASCRPRWPPAARSSSRRRRKPRPHRPR